MRQGFIKVAAATPKVTVADPAANAEKISELMEETARCGAKIIVFPELCITAYTCGDLFLQETLLKEAKQALLAVTEKTKTVDAIVFVGLPLEHNGKLYNVAAALNKGKILGFVPKTHLPNYGEFYEARHFEPGMKQVEYVSFLPGIKLPIGTEQLFCCEEMPQLRIAAEICEDVWSPNPPSIAHAMAGANVIVNLSASDEVTGKDIYRESLIFGQSARLLCGYIYANAGDGESTQDVVYSGHNLIAENGIVLKRAKRFVNETIYSELDIFRLNTERRRMTTFQVKNENYVNQSFSLKVEDTSLTRFIDSAPFVPGNKTDRDKRCEEILMIQSMGLKKRLEHTHCKNAVVGISGGLDSTLALLVTVRAFDLLSMEHSHITAVTMPGFGTTDRTYDNAVGLIRCLGADLKEISIKDAVRTHFRDIGQDESVHDVTYENGQARERTQILMDLANKNGGMVIGTGDMSELALGWATYNGDHMSMYGVNASVPKTLVRHLVHYYADTCGDATLTKVLLDVLDTPVSPELLPPENGKIAQKTEDIVGPYELHDFFLYYVLRFGYAPAKIFRLAKLAFADIYAQETILKWLKTFYRRFFMQQFKRSCLPDGPKVGTVAVSPRGDLRMPSDASWASWQRQLEELEAENSRRSSGHLFAE